MTSSRAHGGWREWSGIVSAIAAIVAVLMFWSVTAPPLATTDEPRHFNSVLRLMQGGGWPPPQTAKLSEGTLVAMEESGHPYGPDNILPVPPEDRSVVTHLDQDGRNGVTPKDWMNQHPPTYYAIVAGALTVLGGSEWRWDQLFIGMRLMSVLFAAAAVIFVLASLRRAVGTNAATILGLLAVISIPQFFNILSMVTNDSLAVFAASGFLYFLVRAWTDQLSTRRLLWNAAGAGVFLGLGLLTKGTLLTAIPVVFITLLVVGIQRERGVVSRLLPGALSMAVAFAVGGWWYLRNILVYGEIQSSNSGTGRNPVAAEGYSLVEFLTTAVAQLAESFWGSIRATLNMPGWLTVALLVAFAVGLVITLVTSRWRALIALLLVYPACVAGLILFHAWEVYWNDHRLSGVQGRYFFGAITIVSLVAALSWLGVTKRGSRVLRAALALGVAGICIILGAWGTRFAFRARWGSEDGLFAALDEAAAAGPFSTAFLITVIAVAALASIVAAAAAGWIAFRTPPESLSTVATGETPSLRGTN